MSSDVFRRRAEELSKKKESPFAKRATEREELGHFGRAKARTAREFGEMYEKYKGFPGAKAVGLVEGLLEGLGAAAPGIKPPEVRGKEFEELIEEKTLTPEQERQALFKDIGEFAGTLGIPLGPVAPTIRGLKPKKAQEAQFNFLKKHGFTEKEMTPLLTPEKKFDFFKGLASKDKKTRNVFESIGSKFSGIYEPLIQKGAKGPVLGEPQRATLERTLTGKLERLPRAFRSEASKDLQEFFNSRQNFADFIQLDQNLNASIGGKTGGKAAIGTLKGPIQEYMKVVNPKLAKEYGQTKELYSTFKRRARDLAPKAVEDLINAGEIYAVAGALSSGKMGWLARLLGLTGARKLAREAIINPKFQNIMSKLGQNVTKGNKKNIVKLMKALSKGIRDDDPELSYRIDKKMPRPQT